MKKSVIILFLGLILIINIFGIPTILQEPVKFTFFLIPLAKWQMNPVYPIKEEILSKIS